MSTQDFDRVGVFRPREIPKYPDFKDHPFKMHLQTDGGLGFSPGLVRPSLAFGMNAFTPTYYGQPLKNPLTGALTVQPVQTGRYFIETTGFWVTLAAIEPRNLRAFVPVQGDIKHETDIAFADPNKKLVQLGTVMADGVTNNIVRSDLTIGDISDVPYTGVPGVGPHDPSVWPGWPTESSGTPYYGMGTDGEASDDNNDVFKDVIL